MSMTMAFNESKNNGYGAAATPRYGLIITKILYRIVSLVEYETLMETLNGALHGRPGCRAVVKSSIAVSRI